MQLASCLDGFPPVYRLAAHVPIQRVFDKLAESAPYDGTVVGNKYSFHDLALVPRWHVSGLRYNRAFAARVWVSLEKSGTGLVPPTRNRPCCEVSNIRGMV